MTINDIKSGVGYMDYAYSKYIVIPTLPLWHKIKVTPNILTTFGLISSVLFIYFLWKRNVVLAIVFLLLRQYFDYADGLLARKYKQISNFGDWYDHIVDSVFFMLPLILLILFHTKKRIIYLCLLIPAILATIINIGCIEKNYKNSNISHIHAEWKEQIDNTFRNNLIEIIDELEKVFTGCKIRYIPCLKLASGKYYFEKNLEYGIGFGTKINKL